MTEAEVAFMADLREVLVKHEATLQSRVEMEGIYKQGATEYRFFSPHGIELTMETVQEELSQSAKNAP